MSKKRLFNIDNLSVKDIDENAELIPLMTPEDEIEISKEKCRRGSTCSMRKLLMNLI